MRSRWKKSIILSEIRNHPLWLWTSAYKDKYMDMHVHACIFGAASAYRPAYHAARQETNFLRITLSISFSQEKCVNFVAPYPRTLARYYIDDYAPFVLTWNRYKHIKIKTASQTPIAYKQITLVICQLVYAFGHTSIYIHTNKHTYTKAHKWLNFAVGGLR